MLTMLLALAASPLPAQSQTVDGRWEAEARRWNDTPKIQLQLRVRDAFRSNHGFSIDGTELPGLRLVNGARGEVRFELRRDAGVIVFEGRQDGDEAWGDFVWTGSDDFRDRMRQLGYASLSTRDQFQMTLQDVTLAFVTAVHERGHQDASARDLIRLRIHGATPDFMAAMADAGYGNLDLDDLIQFRIHGVSADFAADMRDLGFSLSARDLQQARIHGVSADFASAIASVGVEQADFDDLVQFRIHGVTAGFVEEMAARGYDDIRPRTLVQFRIHGVDGAFVDDLKERGFTDLSADDLVQARIHSGWWRRRR